MSNYIISISREFGSGGRLIGKRLAAQLGIPCYDRTIIQKTSEKSGLSPDFIARAEERARSRFHLSIAPVGVGVPAMAHQGVPVSHQAFFAQAEVIRELAGEGPCVIVGRCADCVLAGKADTLNVFIHSEMSFKIERSIAEHGLEREKAASILARRDKARAHHYRFYTDQRWGDARNYDLCLDSGALGVENCVAVIAGLYERFNRQTAAAMG